MEDQKIREIAKILAAEESIKNPSKLMDQNLETEIYNKLKQHSEKRSMLSEFLTKLEEIKKNGGWKAVILKIILWVGIPLVVVGAIGYIIYRFFLNQKIVIKTVKAVNNSTVYKDENTEWQLRIREILPSVAADEDRKNFESVKSKVKDLYGI